MSLPAHLGAGTDLSSKPGAATLHGGDNLINIYAADSYTDNRSQEPVGKSNFVVAEPHFRRTRPWCRHHSAWSDSRLRPSWDCSRMDPRGQPHFTRPGARRTPSQAPQPGT